MSGLSISRTSLGESPLLIGVNGAAPYSLTDTGMGRPAVTARTVGASESPWLHGSTLVSAVRETSALPLEILIQASTDAELAAATAALDEALWQFDYALTVIEGSTSTTWQCSPASYGVADGVSMSFNVDQHFEVWTVTIPVYPIPVT